MHDDHASNVARRARAVVAGLAVATLFLAMGCANTGDTQGTGRKFQGDVLVWDKADRKVSLVMDREHPKLTLTTQFHLRLLGEIEGTKYSLLFTIDPLIVGKRYDFTKPEDRRSLVTDVREETTQLTVSSTAGFVTVSAKDDATDFGTAIVNIDMSQAGGRNLAAVTMTFAKEKKPVAPKPEE